MLNCGFTIDVMLRLFVVVFLLAGAGAVHADGVTFRNGLWRAYLERKDGNNIVFNFEVKDSAGRQVIYMRNAGERILVDDVTREGDSILIRMPFYESQLRARVTSNGNLEGVWLRHLAADWQAIPFKAFYGEGYRFPVNGDAVLHSVSGRWAAMFTSPDGKDST